VRWQKIDLSKGVYLPFPCVVDAEGGNSRVKGAFQQALGAWLGLVQPALDRLTARQPRVPLRLPLMQKIASRVGVAEVALLRRQGDAFAPLAIGDLPLQSLCAATHATIIAAASEGHASGEWVDALHLPGVEAGS
jgi:hypothetical protein